MSEPCLRIAVLLLGLLLPALAPAAELMPARRIEAAADFASKKPGRAAKDLSGMACMAPGAGARRCLVINDENRAAQFATLENGKITPGEELPLLGDAPSPETLGAAPQIACPRPGGFRDLDGEAVPYAAPYFYVAGSHGCARHSGEFRLSAFHLARIRVDAAGRPAGPAELTYRLSDLLQGAGAVAPFLGRDLMTANGLNLEGLAASGEWLWIGLRAPSLAGRATLLRAAIAELFAPGHERAKALPLILSVPVGENRGVRDLAALSDGRLLVLVGPAQEQDLPYELLLLDPARPDTPRRLGALKSRDAKAEIVTILSEAEAALTVLVGYDGGKNGRLEEYRLPLR